MREETEIKNISTKFNGTNRIGDYGYDGEYNIYYCWTKEGWQPFNQYQKIAMMWKKKYEELKSKEQ